MVASDAVLTERWTQLQHHPVQERLWRSTARFRTVLAGRRSGKTELAKRNLVRQLAARKPWPDPRYFFGGPTHEQAKRIAWEDLKSLTPKAWIRGTPSETDLCIKTVFGSELWVLGMDKPQRMEGPPWDGGTLDESCDLKPHTFARVVYPALMDRNGWCWRIGVPKRGAPSSREFKQACEKASRGEDGWEHFSWESASVLPPEIIEHARQTLDPKTYREQLKARWETMSGLAYESFSQERNVRTCPYNPAMPIYVAQDFNVEPMAWVLAHCYDEPERVEVFDELWVEKTRTQPMLNLLWTKYRDHRSGFVFCGDATSQSRSTTAAKSDYQTICADKRFRAAGRKVTYPRANPRVKDRIQATDAMCSNEAGVARLFVDPECSHLIESMEETALAPGTWDIVKTNDEYDITHPSDALSYLIHHKYPIATFDYDEAMNEEEDRYSV